MLFLHFMKAPDINWRKAEASYVSQFPSDYLEKHYHCPDCQDTGYIGTRKCHCKKKAIIELLYNDSNLKGILEQENFHIFSGLLFQKAILIHDRKIGKETPLKPHFVSVIILLIHFPVNFIIFFYMEILVLERHFSLTVLQRN